MQLDRLLSDLNGALRSMDFVQMESLSAMLETVSIPTDRATLHRAARLAEENRAALAAALRGVRAARRRIEELRAGQSLTTYDVAGRRIERHVERSQTHRV